MDARVEPGHDEGGNLHAAMARSVAVAGLCCGAPPRLSLRLDPATLRSRCKNTPFDAARLQGRVKLTLVAGEIVHEEA